jgi:hypothetical protein
VLRADLLSVRRRTTLTGSTIVLARTSDGRHSDFAPALCAAIKEASEGLALTTFDYEGIARHGGLEREALTTADDFVTNADEWDEDEDQDDEPPARSRTGWL